MRKILVPVLLAVMLSSCAGARFFKDEALTQKTGLKYYTAEPYVLVARTEGKDKPVEISVVYLPDLAHPVYVLPGSGIGSRDLKITLSNGMLVSFGSSTEPEAADALKALSTLLTGGIEAFAKLVGAAGFKAPEPGTFELYEIVVEAGRTALRKVDLR
jgi:hypothetical protein